MVGEIVGYAIGIYMLSFLTSILLHKTGRVLAHNEPVGHLGDRIKSLFITYIILASVGGYANQKTHADAFLEFGIATVLAGAGTLVGAVLIKRYGK